MRNKTLRGDKKPDGTYEYETPVEYWMRVTWTGIGFHDAKWQTAFGGEIYKTRKRFSRLYQYAAGFGRTIV